MKKIFFIIVCLTMLIFNFNNLIAKDMKKEKTQNIQVIKNGELPSTKGADSYFTGSVKVDSMLPVLHDSNVSLAKVTFEPNSRTAWHTHPWGQILIITGGKGQIQEWGNEIIEVKEGDTVWFPANVKHWHGATIDNAMSHISIVANSDKGTANWLEKVEAE